MFIKLDSNENQLVHKIDIANVVNKIDPRMYPDVSMDNLRESIGNKFGINKEEVFCSNGSDNLIKVITFCLVSVNEEILIPEVAFPTYEIAAKMKECKYTLIPLKNYGIDLDATFDAISENTKLIWLSNPHNPTGTLLSEDEIVSFMERVPSHINVVLDEAYIEYVTGDVPNGINIYNRFENLILLRTFSKAYGLAGARIGYGFARPEIMNKIKFGLGPFDVNSYAQALALEALKDDSFVALTRESNCLELRKYEDVCEKLSIEYIKSYASFIMIYLGDKADDYCEYLKNHNIVIKNGKAIGVPGWIRISIGNAVQNEKICDLTLKYFK